MILGCLPEKSPKHRLHHWHVIEKLGLELALYLILVTCTSIAIFWLTGMAYGLMRSPAIYFPISLAAKMAVCGALGSLMFIVGGVALATLVFTIEMAKRPDYQQWPAILAGSVISLVSLILIYLSVVVLAWQILD